MRFAHALSLLAAGAALAAAAPALADVKAGVEAWSRGDYPAAVREWREPAAQGNPDAQFNMAQAYRLGRGVERDLKQAEIFYAKAAAQGHIKAADNYGLMLFQAGRQEEAMPYVIAASDRGDPRAQYLLGIAHFNGDMVEKDWVRAYALLTLANSAGLPQASPAIQQMDSYIPLDERQEAQVLAQQLKRESDAVRAQQLAAADLALGGDMPAASTHEPQAPTPVAVVPARSRVPTPIASASVPPSVAAAQAAIVEASRVTGTTSPAQAGADYARPAAVATPTPQVPSQPQPQPTPKPAPEPERTVAATPTPAPAAKPSPSSDGPWRVQLGAFSVAGNADRLWRDVAGLAPLSGKEKFLVRGGKLTKLQAGGFATRSAAQAACDKLKAAGRACLVTR
ncbi:SPOR domain-containing protein [Pelagerythrobacter aerophilus]